MYKLSKVKHHRRFIKNTFSFSQLRLYDKNVLADLSFHTTGIAEEQIKHLQHVFFVFLSGLPHGTDISDGVI